MKKLFLIVWSSIFLGLAFSDTVHATEQPLANGYYHVKPKLNTQLEVDSYFKLGNQMTDYQKFDFFYIPAKQGYVINDQFGTHRVKWSGKTGIGNLVWISDNSTDPSALWTVDKVGNDQFIIRNKKDPLMVWDVHNYYPKLGTPIKLEKLHSETSPQRNAQIFALTN